MIRWAASKLVRFVTHLNGTYQANETQTPTAPEAVFLQLMDMSLAGKPIPSHNLGPGVIDNIMRFAANLQKSHKSLRQTDFGGFVSGFDIDQLVGTLGSLILADSKSKRLSLRELAYLSQSFIQFWAASVKLSATGPKGLASFWSAVGVGLHPDAECVAAACLAVRRFYDCEASGGDDGAAASGVASGQVVVAEKKAKVDSQVSKVDAAKHELQNLREEKTLLDMCKDLLTVGLNPTGARLDVVKKWVPAGELPMVVVQVFLQNVALEAATENCLPNAPTEDLAICATAVFCILLFAGGDIDESTLKKLSNAVGERKSRTGNEWYKELPDRPSAGNKAVNAKAQSPVPDVPLKVWMRTLATLAQAVAHDFLKTPAEGRQIKDMLDVYEKLKMAYDLSPKPKSLPYPQSLLLRPELKNRNLSSPGDVVASLRSHGLPVSSSLFEATTRLRVGASPALDSGTVALSGGNDAVARRCLPGDGSSWVFWECGLGEVGGDATGKPC